MVLSHFRLLLCLDSVRKSKIAFWEFFFCFSFFEMGFWCIVLGGLEFQVFLLQCWDYRHTPPCSTNIHGPFAVSCGSWLLVFLLVNFYYVLSKQVLFSHFLRIKGMIFPLFPVSFPWAYPHQDEQVLQFWLLSVPGPLLSSCQWCLWAWYQWFR